MPLYIAKILKKAGEKVSLVKIFAPSISEAEKEAKTHIKRTGKVYSVSREDKDDE